MTCGPTLLCTFMTTRAHNQTGICLYTQALEWLHTLQPHIPICTLYMQNGTRAPTSSCRPADQRHSSVETCVGDRVSSFIPKTHPHARSLILAHPLITHTDALERQKRKMLCMQNRWAAYTGVRVKKKKEEEEGDRGGREVCVYVCEMQAHFVVYESSLKLFKIAHQSCVRI